jgi:hypothetical protein
MKKQALLIMGLSAFVVCGGAQRTRQHDVVILTFRPQAFRYSVGDPALCGNGSGYNGLEVYNASCSSGAPKYNLPVSWDSCPPTDHTNLPLNAAQTMSDLLDEGFVRVGSDHYSATLIRVR